MPTPPDTVLLGRFRVEAARSRAGGAEVLDAADAAGAPALIVVVHGAPAGGEDAASVLRRSARYALGIGGLEPPLDAGDVEGGAPGRSLAVAYARRGQSAEALIDAGPAAPALASRVVSGAAEAIASLHDQGIAHGYLRPELVRVDGDRVRVSGFGVAQVAQSLGDPRLARDALPVAYRAPELRGATPSRAGTWSDVWALGVLACELLVGKRAPEHVDTPTPAALGATLPAAVAQHIEAALATSVGSRPHDLRAWAAALAQALAAAPGPLPLSGGDAGPARPAARSGGEETPAPVAAAAAPVAAAAAPVAAAPAPVAAAPAPAEGIALPDDAVAAPPQAAPDEPIRDVTAPAPTPAPPSTRAAKREGVSVAVIVAFIAGLFLMLGAMGVGIFMAVSARKAPVAAATAPPTPVPLPPPAPADPDAGTAAGGAAGTSGPGMSVASDAGVAERADAGAADAPVAHAVLGPDDARAVIPLDRHTPVWGRPNALVTIVLFGDLDCPHTRRMLGVLRRVRATLGDDVRLAWKNRPIPAHPHARGAAQVAAALHDESGDAAFWALAAEAAHSTNDSTPSQLATWVTSAGGDGGRVAGWIGSTAAGAVVDADLDLAGRFDVRATPTLFVNGIRIEGEQSEAALAGVVRREIAHARSSLASGIAERALYATRTRQNLVEQGNDTPDRACPPVGKSPVRGPDDAIVTVVEFSDFECPYCKRVQPTLDSLLAHHPDDVRLVWKNYPLPAHPHARAAADFALEAYARGGDHGFWRVEQLLFGAPSLDDASLGLIARSAGLDDTALLDAARRDAHGPVIDADVRLGDKLGVTGTPTFFVNGRQLSGAQPLSAFETVVGEEILVGRHLVAAGTPRARVYDALCGAR